MDNLINCPHCKNEFPLDQVMSAQLDETIRSELEAEFSEKTRRLVDERNQLAQQKKQLAAGQEQLDQQVQDAVAKQRGAIESKAQAVAQQAVAVEIKDRDQRLAEASERLMAFEQQELGLRKKARQLEQQAEQQELEIGRRMDVERKKVRDQVLAQAQEENQFKQAEKDLKIQSMIKQIDELKQKAEQGSQQIQGEVQEIELEKLLPELFPGDVIEPVAKGVRGADVLQHVFDHNGRDCGAILWESKRTKNWSDKWLSKVRDDQEEAKANCACIISAALPESIRHFGEIGDVWVANFSCVRSVAVAIRRVLIETAQARLASEGQQGKMEIVYSYLFGPEFRNRVRGLVEPYVEMQTDLESEKRAFQRHWNKRQKQLDRALASTTGLYGDLQGILGSGLQEIEGMDLLALGVDEEPG
ncbi:MAG: DUF2130 domain-containing protein [Planctomycetes bacterium]|nr:DUF2130 domain-containing protein [Planctomycetota bacterium]